MVKKVFLGFFLACFMIIGYNSITAAEPTAGDKIPGAFFNVYQMDNTTAVGLKQKIVNRLFLSSDIEYKAASKDLMFQVGAVYFFRNKFDLGVFLDRLWSCNIYFYPGAGLQISRDTGEKSGFLVLGINFLCFFSESIYPFAPGMKPELRTGLSFSL